MKSIYVLAVLAVVSLSLVPIAADDSDGATYTINYIVLGDTVAYGTQNDLNVPDVEAPNGYIFDGWYYLGEVIDPYTYPFESGLYTLVAHFSEAEPEPEPEPESDINWISIALPLCVILVLVMIVVLVVRNMR